MTQLRLAVAQPFIVANDVATNAHAHAALVKEALARVVVFPELSLTGYELDAPAPAPALAVDDARLEPLIEACRENGCVALAGAPVEGPHIAMLAITGDGVTVAYRKQWLGDVEAQRFSPGPGPAAIEVDGWRLGLAICKDTGVPRHASDTAALGIDAYLAGTVKYAHEAVPQAERAHRIATSHRVWVALASFAGPTGGGFTETAANSAIWSPDGTIVAQAGPTPGSVIAATLSR
ncbi:MAG TPA: carbon-nitrogen hydrolase family protein [Candidatus Limnocylindrales bacterium]|nr:carbon-nitrogen hydrolase family protein [Candidatus Limnocylindrales bacterium]